MAKQNKTQEPQITDAEIVNENAATNGGTELLVVNPAAEIRKYEIADAAIEEMLKRTKKIKLKSEDDAEGFELVKAAHKEYVSTRTAIDAKRKEINKPFDLIIKSVNAEGKRLIEKFAAEEARLNGDKERFVKWQKDEEMRLFKEAEQRKDERVKALRAAGIVFDGEMYSIGEISVDVVTIGKMSEEDFEFLIAKVKIAKQKIDEAAAEEKRLQEEAEAQARAAARKVEEDRIALRNEKIELRAGALVDLGLKEYPEHEHFKTNEGRVYTYDFIADLTAEDFKFLRLKLKEETDAAERAAAERATEEANTAAANGANLETQIEPAAKGKDKLTSADIFSGYIEALKSHEEPKFSTQAGRDLLYEFEQEFEALVARMMPLFLKLK